MLTFLIIFAVLWVPLGYLYHVGAPKVFNAFPRIYGDYGNDVKLSLVLKVWPLLFVCMAAFTVFMIVGKLLMKLTNS